MVIYLTHQGPVLPLIASQLTGFYMRATLALNGLNPLIVYESKLIIDKQRLVDENEIVQLLHNYK